MEVEGKSSIVSHENLKYAELREHENLRKIDKTMLTLACSSVGRTLDC